jgi:hypothetical protein
MEGTTPRVTVTADAVDGHHGNAPVLLDEQVQGAQLGDQHSSVQVLECLAGAIGDGESRDHLESVTSYLEVDRC